MGKVDSTIVRYTVVGEEMMMVAYDGIIRWV